MQYLPKVTVVLALLCAKVYSQSLSSTTSRIASPVISASVSASLLPTSLPSSLPGSPAQIFVTDPTCPAANGSYFLSHFKATFRIGCPNPKDKAKRQDIVNAYISRFADCIEVCDPSTPCLGMLFNPNTLSCAGYKCQPAPLNNSWAAGITAKGGVPVDQVSCGSDQNSQLLFNVENAILNSAGSTATVSRSSTQTPSTSYVTSVAQTTVNTPAPSQFTPSSTATYTPLVVQTNVANPLAIPRLLAGVAAAFPIFGL